MKSRTSRTVFGESLVKKVELVVTRNPRRFRLPDRLDGNVEHTLAVDCGVMPLAETIQVDNPREVRRGLEPVHLPLRTARH